MQASVVVTEGATGIERNGSVENTCYFSSPYRIEFQDGKYSGKFQPGLALSGSVSYGAAAPLRYFPSETCTSATLVLIQ